MEADNSPSQRPIQRPAQPSAPSRPLTAMGRPRPMVDGFAPRRPAMPAHPGMQHRPAAPAQHAQPQHHPARPISVSSPAPTPAPVPTQQAPRPVVAHHVATPEAQPQPRPVSPVQPHHAQPAVSHAPQPQPQADHFTSVKPLDTDLPKAGEEKEEKEPNRNGHAGLIGLAAFIVFGALLISPLIPGKVFDSFPLSSQNFSTGDQALSCLGTQGQIQSTTKYTSKSGAPITYSYATSTTQTATCNGQSQTAVTGKTSQFNPLGLLIDVVTAVVIAVVIGKVWGIVYRRRH